MDYRFTLTPRLIAIAAGSFLMLLVLLFALGFQLGQQWAVDEAQQQTHAPTQRPLNWPVGVPAMPTPATLLTTSPAMGNAGVTPAPQAPPVASPSGMPGKP